MSLGWTAGTVRAKALLSRRCGAEGARELAARPALDEALHVLAAGPYRHDVRPGQTLAEAEHAVGATLLWHMRVLAGWQPRRGAEVLRLLAGWFEIANVVEHMRALNGQRAGQPYRLGALATAWPQLARTSTQRQLRRALAASVWADPGEDTPASIATGMQLAWATRVAVGVPEAAAWAAGGAALLVARELFLSRHRLPDSAARKAAVVLGADAVGTSSLAGFAGQLGPAARWS